MKYKILPLLAMLIILCFPASSGAQSKTASVNSSETQPAYSLQTFKGKKIASITGTVFDKLINSVIPDVTHLYFNDYTSMTEALRLGKVDAVGVDQPVGKMLEGKCPELIVFPLLVLNDKLGFACRKGDKLAVDAANAIEEMRRNGTMDQMAKRWLSGKDELMVIPPELERQNESSGGLLRFAHDNVSMPMGYSGAGGKSLGYDVELALRIGVALNRKVELIPMSFGGLLAALQSGKADMVGGCLSVTEERAKSVDFAGSYYQSGIALLVRKETIAAPVAAINKCGDLSGKPVGTISGTKFDTLLKKKVPGAIPQYFNNYPDQLWATRSGKIAGFVVDEPVARRMTAMHSDLRMLPDVLCSDQYAFLFPKSKEALRNEFNRILGEMRSTGMLKAMDKKWFSIDDSTRIMPDYPTDGTRGILTMAADTSSDPFTYLHKGKMLGLEVDVAQYIAARLGYKLKITTPDLSTIIDAVNSGKVDFAACCISITEERKKSMLFSDPHYDGGVVIVTMAKGKATAASAGKKLSRWEGFKLSFERTFVTEDRYKLILDGLWVTILISVLAALLGTLLGFVVCMARRAAVFWAVLPAKAFIGILRGTPLLVILMILYYIVFASVNVNPIMIAVLGFSLNFAAYVSEMMRSGIDSVDKGQLEAASSMGFSRFKIFWKITFPHAARYVIPVYKGEFISMLKMTSVVGYIAIQDLTKMSDIIRSRTYEAFFPLLSTALIYFFLAYVMTAALGFIEVKIDPKRRKRIIKGVVTK